MNGVRKSIATTNFIVYLQVYEAPGLLLRRFFVMSLDVR